MSTPEKNIQDFPQDNSPDSTSFVFGTKIIGGITRGIRIARDTFIGPQGLQGIQGDQGDPGNDGVDGREVELGNNGTYIQWRYSGDATRNDIITLASLKGDQGDDGIDGTDGSDGENIELQTNSTHIQWRVVGSPTWNDLVLLSSLKGDDGLGISGITLESTVGKVKTYRITYTDATYFDYTVTDGNDGAGTGDMLKSTYDPTNKNADAFSMDNMVEGTTTKILTSAERTKLSNTTNTNSGDETTSSIKTKLSVTGNVVGDNDTQTITNKRITTRVTTEVSSATPTINTDNSDAHSITALATAITSMTTNLSGTPTNFQKLLVRIKDDGTARAITWGSSFEAKGVALPTTTVASKVTTIGLIYDTVASKRGCVAVAQEA